MFWYDCIAWPILLALEPSRLDRLSPSKEATENNDEELQVSEHSLVGSFCVDDLVDWVISGRSTRTGTLYRSEDMAWIDESASFGFVRLTMMDLFWCLRIPTTRSPVIGVSFVSRKGLGGSNGSNAQLVLGSNWCNYDSLFRQKEEVPDPDPNKIAY